MKIAIKGHKSRGKEVARILEGLGGKNLANHNFTYNDLLYYLNFDNFIICSVTIPSEYKGYTLEEFEKEFPFKIGDRVISITTGCIGTITKLSENGWYYVNYDNGNFACTFGQNLKLYKEMERNITLTLDKAKEWYKKGGELKEVALQAFSETELNPLPRSWEEFCENNKWDNEDYVELYFNYYKKKQYISIPKETAEAHIALIRLEQLRNCWWNGWEPIWDASTKYAIKRNHNEIHVIHAYNVSAFLVFPTREMAEEFIECFKDLIEKAGDLI